MKVQCPVCRRKRDRIPSEKQHQACSNECGQKLRFINLCNKVTKDRFVCLYLEESKSFRQMEQILGVCVKTLRRMARHFSIEIRHGGEAVSTQWIGNSERRRLTSERLTRIRTGLIPWNKGLDKTSDA